eukprot:6258029-Amphidinium_carterae.1
MDMHSKPRKCTDLSKPGVVELLSPLLQWVLFRTMSVVFEPSVYDPLISRSLNLAHFGQRLRLAANFAAAPRSAQQCASAASTSQCASSHIAYKMAIQLCNSNWLSVHQSLSVSGLSLPSRI